MSYPPPPGSTPPPDDPNGPPNEPQRYYPPQSQPGSFPQYPQQGQYPQKGQYPHGQYPPPPPGSYPPPPGYGGGPYGGPPPHPRNGLGVGALVLGIIAIVLCWTVVGGIILGIIGVVLGVLGVRRVNQNQATNRGMSIGGAVVSGVGLLLGILFLVLFAYVFNQPAFQDLRSCVQDAHGNQAKIQQCENEFRNQVGASTVPATAPNAPTLGG